MTMSFVCSLAADELSERINDLHQNLTQLKSKLEKLKNGLDTISKRLRGEAVGADDGKEELKIDYKNFSQKINETLNALEGDITQQDAALVGEVKAFRESLLDNRNILRGINTENIEEAIKIIKNSCTELVKGLLNRYEQVAILKVSPINKFL